MTEWLASEWMSIWNESRVAALLMIAGAFGIVVGAFIRRAEKRSLG